MKILSGPEGDGPLSNVEVLDWIKDSNFDAEKSSLAEGQIRPPLALSTVAKQVRKYIESSPAANVTISSLKELEKKLEKFNLSAAEFTMIGNNRPEAYAHLIPMVADVYNRFGEEELTEMLQIINETLPKRKQPAEKKDGQSADDMLNGAEPQGEEVGLLEPSELAPQGDEDAPMLDLDEPITATSASGAPLSAMQVDTAGPAALTADISDIPAEPIGKAKKKAHAGSMGGRPAGNAATTTDERAKGADGATSKGGKYAANEKKNRRKEHDKVANQPTIDAAATDISQL